MPSTVCFVSAVLPYYSAGINIFDMGFRQYNIRKFKLIDQNIFLGDFIFEIIEITVLLIYIFFNQYGNKNKNKTEQKST